MTAALNALEQVSAFWALLVAGWWVGPAFPHDADGVDVPLRRLAERSVWMARYDPLLSDVYLQKSDGAR